MKFCTSCFQDLQTREKVDEVRFQINSIGSAATYAEEHPNQRIIVEVKSLVNLEDVRIGIDKLLSLIKENKNLYMDFYDLNDLKLFSQVSEKNKHYMYHYPATSWNMVSLLKEFNVSDITLGEPLVFQYDNILNYIKKEFEVNIRINPTLGQPKLLKDTADRGIHHFWILPQHLHLFEEVFDVCDLTDSNLAREKSIVEVYLSKYDYILPLSALFGFNTPIWGKFIEEDLMWKRSACGQTCMISKNKCHYCDMIEEMYRVLEEKNK